MGNDHPGCGGEDGGKYQSFILHVLEHDWIDDKVISDITNESYAKAFISC